MIAVLVTGGFDPIHSGHIQYFNDAKKLGDRLIVGLNSDHWLTRKKGRPFMNLANRAIITQNLSMVDEVIMYNDEDDTSCHAIHQVLHHYDSVILQTEEIGLYPIFQSIRDIRMIKESSLYVVLVEIRQRVVVGY